MKLLLVEDDLPLGDSLLRVLQGQQLRVVWVRRCDQALQAFEVDSFDLVLLDIVLPDGSGLEVLHALRSAGRDLPVMMLTARDAISDRVAGLDGGADDYLAKPFAMDELLSRIRVLLRRRGRQLSAVWRVGALHIDTARRRVEVDGAGVAVSAREYDILVTLAAEPGRVMTRAQIEAAITHADLGESNALDVHVYNLRRKIGAQRIGTVRGVGYVLETG